MKKIHHPSLEDNKKPFCGIAGKNLNVDYGVHEELECKRCKHFIEVAIREELAEQDKMKG
jgi:hypothetical protein